MKRFSTYLLTVTAAFGLLFFVGCDSAGPSSDDSEVQVGFKTSPSSKSAAYSDKSSHQSLVLDGSNGTLEITDLRLIVSEVELEGEADSAEFETERPSFLDLPLDTTDVAPMAADRIPPGTYNEFKFKVEDVELDEDDDEEEFQNLQEEIQNEGFTDWPEKASMVVVGTFTPDGEEQGQSFKTYFEAEIEVEIEMEDRPFEVDGDGLSRRLTVNLDPAQWFSNADGTVQDLSQQDYQGSDDLVEFEVEFEEGVTEIEFDD